MHGISHIAIGVRDMDKSLAFYRDVLGLRVVADEVERLGGMRGVTDHQRRAARLIWDNGSWATYVVLSQSPGTASGTPSKLDQIGTITSRSGWTTCVSASSELNSRAPKSYWLPLNSTPPPMEEVRATRS